MINIKYFLVVQFLFSFCLCEISSDQEVKLLNDFIRYYNNLPNQVYHSEDGSLLSTRQVDDTTYQIAVNLRVVELPSEATKLLKCTATIQSSDNDVTVTNNNCEDVVEQKQSPAENEGTTPEVHVEVVEPIVERKPVQLVNEVQDSAGTSGEQFIAIPRNQPSAPCVGCASHVNPQAAGVSDLANLGLRHLNLHEPSVKHSLDSVIDVERQVQVVNGVRYMLVISVNSNNCTEVQSEDCASSKICKITILVKPWVKLPNGGNYRAILANNCTDEWQYGDNGEVLPELSTDSQLNEQSKGKATVNPDDINAGDVIQAEHTANVQSQPNPERSLTDAEIKNIQEQIIPNAQFQEVTEAYQQSFTTSDAADVSKQHVFKVESGKHNENAIPVTESEKTDQHTININLDKKKAIDELLDFFDFSGFKPKTEVEDVIPRVRRSYDYDLQVLSLAEDFHGIKNSIKNARFMYEMAQAMVDYLNEMDMEVKKRVVKNVIRAEDETENHQRFVYIQASVTIPCDTVECEPRDVDTQICNGVIDCTNENRPQILTTFCYNDNKESDYRDDIKEIPIHDSVLKKMAVEAVKKIESESNSQYAMKINKIVSAITQVTSGTLTKISVIVENIKCDKKVPLVLRMNCTVLEQLGSKICEIIVHERHWLKEKRISYTCTDRPTDMRISKSKMTKNVTVDDPQIIEMLQEAIQYLESQSDKTNKQKIVKVTSISSQIVAGFLTNIELVVGYTDCTDENYSRDQINKCELLKDEALRSCKAQIWDRSWIMDGRQVEVSCDDVAKSNEFVNSKKKRSIDSTRAQEQQTLNKDDDIDYKKLANESLYKFMQSSSSHQHYEVVKVDKALVQDVSRKFIKIYFSISPTNCLIYADGHVSWSKCDIVDPKNIIHCHSKILQNNWIGKKQYFVNCNIKYQQNKTTNELKERDPSDSKYYQLAEESLAKYLQDTGNLQHIITRVEKVTTQIVNGLLTRIDFIITPKNQSNNQTVRCHSDILEKRWLGSKDFNVSCLMKQKMKVDDIAELNTDNPKYMQIAVESLQKYIKIKPESDLMRVVFVDKAVQTEGKIKIRFIASHAEEDDGDTICDAEVYETIESKTDIDVKCQSIGRIFRKTQITEDDPNYYKYVELADKSLQHLQMTGSSFYSIVNIESVTVKWDDGIKTLINFTISSIDSESDLMRGKQCVTEILEQPWLNINIDNVKCGIVKDLYRVKRQLDDGRRSKIRLIGGAQDQDPAEPQYLSLAEESLRKYTIDSGITHPLKVASVEKVTTQVVSGSLTKIDFLVSGSSDSEIIKCHSEVWEQPWLKKKDITVTCGNDGHRGKRQIPGGTQDQDPAEPQYLSLAEESLRKYTIDSGITHPLKVASVEKVTTQVVSGSLTKIDFLVSGSLDSETIKCHSEVWEQPWLKKKDITVTCKNDGHRGKRQIPGGTLVQDPAEPQYLSLAEESLRKYMIDFRITHPLKVASVEKVTTQVVPGSLTKIDFLVSGSPDSETIKCHSEVWEQPWLKKKDITVTCENDGHRGKRQIPGGTQDQDPAEPQYLSLAEESLRKYTIDSGITHPLKVASVEKVTTQVVSGSLTKIDFLVSGSPDSKTIKCHSEVWKQPWLKKKKITVTCENDGYRGKRQIPGGTQDQDPAKPQYLSLAEESLRKYTIDSGITHPLKVASVEKVTTQVVSGSLTKIDFLVSGSPDSKTIKCHSEVWEQPWLKKKDITVTCENDGYRGKRQIPGGTQDQDPAEPQYLSLAEESLRKYTIDSGITHPLKVASVEKVTTQVVSGSLTKIDFLVSGSPDSKTIKCHSEVWEQPWLKKKDITVTCENGGHRGKRQIPGGTQDQDPAEPQYLSLAEESLRKYTIDSGITHPLKVASVEKVTTQVVSGSLTKIDFLVSGSPDSKTIKCHSEVWEQLWLKKKDITVTCENDGHRGKRQIPGGTQDQDPAEPQYLSLAEESLRKYTIDSGITHPLKVASVEKVTTQVVSGSLTKIDFLVSGSPDSKTIKCHSEVWEQPWLKKKDITVTCENDGHRGKRQILGGTQDQDPAEPQYLSLAEESLRKYTIDSGITHPLKVASVEKVTTQVVSGSLTKIDFLVSGSPDSKTIKCHSEVWEQLWLKKKDITVTCENDGHRGKRQIPGGTQDQDPAEPQYLSLAEESLRKYTIDSGITHPLKVASVEKVTTQVVSGSLTKIDFLVSGSPDSKTIKCHSEVWEQPWLKKKDITVTCENDGYRGKRQIPGGTQDQDPAKPQYLSLAEESLRKYTIDSGIAHPLKVVRVEKVTTQVVSGSLTKIDFLVSGSPDSETIKCHSEVWEQPWLKKKDITVTCENDGHRGKRQIPGGTQDQDPAEPQYLSLAEESLRKYTIDSGITHPLKVASVEKVTTQVVSGSLTKIDFLVSGSPDSKTIKCHSEVWEQLWLKKKDITVTCENDGHRGKRQIPGGTLVQDPAEPQYLSLAEESLRKYMIDFRITHPLKVASIEKVTTQVVPGSRTKIDFLVSGSPDSETIKCHSEVWEQPWLKKKDITVTCENDGHRGKRQIPGGTQDQDPAEPQYLSLAEESLRKYTIDSGITHPLKVASVEKVTTQVVSGSLTKIDFLVSGSPDSKTIKCHSEVWEQPWLKKKDITVTCENDGHRGKRQIPGGTQDQDPAEPQYLSLAEESLRKYTIDSGITHPLKVASVEKVTTQVVSGSLTKIDFLVSGSPDSKTIKCHSEVWEQLWLKKKDITVTCENDGHRGKRQIPGGTQDQDPAEPQYLSLAEESLRKYTIDSGITHPLKVASVEKVTTQVVSGSLTKIDFLVSGSPDSKTIKCHSEVWEQPWLKKKDITVTCENDGYRGKRQIPGGTQDQDPAKPQYLSLAEESLRKYTIDSGIAHPLKVVRVEKVTTQVVSGSLTKIDFLVSGSPDSETIKCHSEVWEQPWLKKKDITVTCENDGHRGKRQIPGGTQDQDPAEPQYLSLAEESLRKYTIDSGITHPLKVASVEKVTTQVVSGSLTKIDFLVSGSPDSKTIKCHSEVWEQLWLKKKDITVTCENDGHRGKRQIPGGTLVQDPAEPQYLSLAEESLRKYMIDFRITHPLKVASIEKVTTQVVPGSRTKIDFLVSGSPDSETIKCHSEVWEQPWLKKKDITVTCENDGHRGKRQIPGGTQDQDPAEPQYLSLAEESLRKYTIDSGITHPLKVASVEKVTTQVVSGSLTKIDFLVSGSPDSKTIKCHSEVWEQPWLKKKDITVTCENDGHRGKRQIPGGTQDQDPAEPQYLSLAEESLRKYTIDSGITHPLKVASVEKVTTQVVSGSLTKIDFLVSGSPDSKTIKCHSEVWEQPWLKKKDITVTCENDGHRGKRQIPGGTQDQDPAEPQYLSLAEESLRKYTIDSGITHPLKVASVEKVTTQVVSGSLTKIDFLVSGSPDSKTIKCHSEVWEQPWLKKKDITVTCENDGHRGKRQIPGGTQDQDPAEPQYLSLAEESLRKYTIDSGIAHPLKVVRVEKVTTQVVSGSLTKIDFLVSGSPDSETIKCHSEVWEQPWLKKKDITVTCENDGHRGKRQIPGGTHDQDPAEPQYLTLAEESLRKYTIDFGITHPLKVVRVDKVTTQVVSGSLTKIDFLVSGSPDSETIKCHSEIWEQAWLNKKDITVTCQTVNGRVKRDLEIPVGASKQNLRTAHYNALSKKLLRGNSKKGQQQVDILRGHNEEEQDPNKPEYKLLAEESLRKFYQKNGTVYHKVLEVNRVVIRVVSGFKYNIDFTAAPTACSMNVSSARARNCKTDESVVLYCHTDIWDRPWLKQKKIDVTCNQDDDESEDSPLIPSDGGGSNVGKYNKLAEEASEKYLTTSNRKYVHKVTEIISASEQVANGTLIDIHYSLSPTTCLRNETTNKTSCELKQPLVVFNCSANIHQWLNIEKEITVTCKKLGQQKSKKLKRALDDIRQIDDDEEFDEDTTNYYADRAVQYLNDQSNSNNLYKLVSVHAVQNRLQMGTLTAKLYIEVVETFCLRHRKKTDLRNCDEMAGLNHKLCLARLWPSPDDELVVRHVTVVCDDDSDFVSITGLNIPELMKISINVLENSPQNTFKLVHQGEPQVIPTLDTRRPFKINFVVGVTNCSKDINLDKNPFQCYLNPNVHPKNCRSFMWLNPETKYISHVEASCNPISRNRRSPLNSENKTSDYEEVQKLVTASLEKLEMQSLHRYKQRVLQINSHSTRITSGRVTTIDFDVGYTSCLKYEWVANITNCNFLEHLPRRRCVSQIWERLWTSTGKVIDVNCVDDETPLESHVEFESAEMAHELARQALKHIEAKYPHPSKQKVVRIFSLEKQVVAGIHYKMKVEVGFTDCTALSDQKDCKLVQKHGLNKFCRINVWIRPWTDHPPNFRVSCDYQEGATHDLYHHVQAEHLFYVFLTTYSPSYVNNYSQMQKRFEIFKNNIKKIHEMNIHEKGTAVYGVTRFTDLTYEEFSRTYMGLKTNLTNENQVPMKKANIPDIKVPQNFDWRDYDAVTEVKDQGSCGSCWAFSVTGNIEGQWKMQSGQLVSLSEQELVDCDKLDEGCNGGLPDNAYRAIEQMGGLELESDYPYEGEDDKCAFNKTLAKVQISSAVNITSNETGMAQWLVHNGPISIGINANAMQFYMGGISHPWKMLCNPTNLDHGVLIVGYGVKDYPLFQKKLPYWIVKNSWGKSWGEQGYYRVYRGDGTCGVNQMASSAVI